MGTILEDGISLFVVNQLHEIPVRLMAATAFGAERDITYSQVLENIATLVKARGFLGSCSLTPQMEVYQSYEEAVLYVQSQPFQDPSVINSSLISAVRGHYGNHHLTEKTRGSTLWISPLMPIYWFFEVSVVAQHNYLFSNGLWTQTITEALEVYITMANFIPRRSISGIPLP
jgi:hypothetical protein